MKHEHTDSIICPHCENEHQEGWKWHLEENIVDKVTCDSCGEDFNATLHASYSFSSSKIQCREHKFSDEYFNHEVDIETCKRWNDKNFCNRSDHKPYKLYRKECRVCDGHEDRIEYI